MMLATLLLVGAIAAPGTGAVAVPSSEAQARLLMLADTRTFDAATLPVLAAHPDPTVRATCATVLGELANADAVPLLTGLAADKVPAVRLDATAAIGRLAAALPKGAPARGTLARLLERLLWDRAATVRAAAAWSVGMATPGEGELWLLHRLARERDASARAAMLMELGRFPGKLWPKRAIAYLRDRDPGVRFAAAWSLAQSARAAAIPGLRRAIHDADPHVRRVGLDGAGRIGRVDLWGDVIGGLEDPVREVRIAACGAIEALAKARIGRALPPRAVARLGAMILDPDPAQLAADKEVESTWAMASPLPARQPELSAAQERVAAIRAAVAAGCYEPGLREIAMSDAPWLCSEALSALLQMHVPGAGDRVTEWLASKDRERRRDGVRLLPLVPDGTSRLMQLLRDPDAEIRLAAVEACAEVSSSKVTTALVGCLDDADPMVVVAAVEALARRRASRPANELLALLSRSNMAAAPEAAAELVRVIASADKPAPGVEKALENRLRDKHPAVARAAWEALTKLGRSVPLPRVDTGKDLAFYSGVVSWASADHYLEIVTVRGTMQVRLDTSRAPLTCYRLAELAEKHFFDNLTFHRVELNFVVQGGDPRGDGWGGPGFVMRDELDLEPFVAGAVGIALAGPDSGGSQFFVTLSRRPDLDGRYPLVGSVVNGFDVAEHIRRGDRIIAVHAGEGPLPAFFPVLYGPIDPARLDASVKGWREARQSYHPQQRWLDRLRSATLSYTLTVAMGTWCSDSRELVPHLQAILAALGKDSRFGVPHLIGMDRSKEIDHGLYPFGPVEGVPTIVVTVGTTEIGRVVESPKSGSLEEDLVRILAPVEGWEMPAPATPAR
jgi:cyclophilin family peptidyl-prolyl cis-trans isomerase